MYTLSYPTCRVLDLARHATTAPAHLDIDGVVGDNIPPALHVVADWWAGPAIQLASNGCPDLPPWTDPVPGYQLVADPDGCDPEQQWTQWMDCALGRRWLVVAFPLLHGRTLALIDRIRFAHQRGLNRFHITITATGITAALRRRP